MGKGLNAKKFNGMRQKRRKRKERMLARKNQLRDKGVKIGDDIGSKKISKKRARKLRIRAKILSGATGSDPLRKITAGDVEMIVASHLDSAKSTGGKAKKTQKKAKKSSARGAGTDDVEMAK